MRFRTLISGLLMAAMAAFLIGCPPAADVSSEGGLNLRISVNGAGASFPQPVYTRWAKDWNKNTGMKVNYQAIGSGAGREKIAKKEVDFGASDDPVSADDETMTGIVQFPLVIGGVVVIYNLEGVGANELRLDGEVLGRIYLKQVTRWNDPAIVDLQDEAVKGRLPNLPISVVTRADSSGTTYLFTYYLNKTSRAWKDSGLGYGKKPGWNPDLSAPKNQGVATTVQQNPGTIGYVEYAYVKSTGLSYSMLRNKSGKFVEATPKTFLAAASAADWANAPADFNVDLVDMPGEDCWPIVSPTYILVHEQQEQWNKAAAILKFFEYCYKEGAAVAEELDYVPIPPVGYNAVMDKVWTKIKAEGKAVWPIQ